MIKHFCDCCGKGLHEDTPKIGINMSIVGLAINKRCELCDDCFKNAFYDVYEEIKTKREQKLARQKERKNND